MDRLPRVENIPDELLDVLLVDERGEDEALQAHHRLAVVGFPIAVGHLDMDPFAAHRAVVEVAEEPPVVVVVPQQFLPRAGVGALAVLDGPGVHAVGIDPEDRYRSDAVVVEHRGRIVPFEVLAKHLGHLDEVAEEGAEADLPEEQQVGVRGQHPRAAAGRLQREHPGVSLAALKQVRHLFPAPDEELHVGSVANQEQA